MEGYLDRQHACNHLLTGWQGEAAHSLSPDRQPPTQILVQNSSYSAKKEILWVV